MSVYFTKTCVNGKPVDRKIRKSFEYFVPMKNHSWVLYEPKLYEAVRWLMHPRNENGDVYIHNFDPFYFVPYNSKSGYEPVSRIKTGYCLIEFVSAELHTKFEDLFKPENRLTPIKYARPVFDKPDEPVPYGAVNMFYSFPKGEKPRPYYRSTDNFWFADSPSKIMSDMGFSIDTGKINNLVSFANGDLDLWYYVSLMPVALRAELGEEWINILLGPIAAALKTKGLNFNQKEAVIAPQGLLMLFEAMDLGLIPKGVRKALYEALIARFNKEWYQLEDQDENVSRVLFYEILSDILEPIFSEAGADELTNMIVKVLSDNPKQAAEAKTDPKVVGWIMGQVLRSSPSKLDPNTVRAAILEKL